MSNDDGTFTGDGYYLDTRTARRPDDVVRQCRACLRRVTRREWNAARYPLTKCGYCGGELNVPPSRVLPAPLPPPPPPGVQPSLRDASMTVNMYQRITVRRASKNEFEVHTYPPPGMRGAVGHYRVALDVGGTLTLKSEDFEGLIALEVYPPTAPKDAPQSAAPSAAELARKLRGGSRLLQHDEAHGLAARLEELCKMLGEAECPMCEPGDLMPCSWCRKRRELVRL